MSGDSVSVNHGEFIFTSETEAGTWLENESVHTIGIFWDVFSVLVALAPKRLSGKERADQKYSSERISTTTAENELAASMAYERAQTLYGDKHGNKDSVHVKHMRNGLLAHNPLKLSLPNK